MLQELDLTASNQLSHNFRWVQVKNQSKKASVEKESQTAVSMSTEISSKKEKELIKEYWQQCIENSILSSCWVG